MISRTVEYALRAIVWLASRPQTPHTTKEVAQATQVPTNYLAKVLQTLAEARIISSQRGLGGGFELARDPATLSVLEVVNAVAPIQRIHSCPLRLSSHALQLCALHQRLDDALATVERAFASCTIGELLAAGPSERPLCLEPSVAAARPAAGNLAGPSAALSAEAPASSAGAARGDG